MQLSRATAETTPTNIRGILSEIGATNAAIMGKCREPHTPA